MLSLSDIQVNKEQFKEVIECLPKNFIQVQTKMYYNELSKREQDEFEFDKFMEEGINSLFKKYEHIVISIEDKVFGVVDNKYYFLSLEPCIYDAAKALYPFLTQKL